MTLTPTPNPGPQPGIPADVNYWPVARPNPDPDVLEQQREAQHRQRLAQLSSGAHPSRTSDRHEGATSGSALAAPTNVLPSTDHAVVAVSPAFTVTRGERRKLPPGAKPLPPYDPARVEAFTAFILVLLVAGIVAVACVFPYQGTREQASDDRRWEVTLARWFARNDFPAYEPLEAFAAPEPGRRDRSSDERTRDAAEKEEDGRLEGIFDAYLRDERGVLTDGNIGGSSPEPSPRA
jgi:hypothetical protein